MPRQDTSGTALQGERKGDSMNSKRTYVLTLSALLLVVMLFSLTACNAMTINSDLGDADDTPGITESPSNTSIATYVADVSVVDGDIILAMSDGTVKNIGPATAYVTNHNISVNGTSDEVHAQAIAKTLLSTVGVECGFTVTEYTGGGFFGGYTPQDTIKYAYGSGVIYQLDKTSGSAYIITNYHVVYQAECKDPNGISSDIGIYMLGDTVAMDATFVGGSDKYDIAVLRVEDEPRLRASAAQAVTLATGDALVGSKTIIAGNANGYGISVTEGIISVDSEYIEMYNLKDESVVDSFRVIRTDGSVNPGNSGGGLYNADAELLGIVNAKTVDEDTEGMGYAIPVDIATTIADKVIDGDMDTTMTTRRVLLGVRLMIKESSMVYDAETGLVHIEETVSVVSDTDGVAGVEAGGLGEAAGLQAGDIFLSIQVGTRTARSVTRQFHVIDEMLKARAGDTVTIVVDRAGTQHTLTVTVPTDYHG